MKLESMLIGVNDHSIELVIRRETSDTELVGQIFVDGAFDISRLRRFEELKSFVVEARQGGARPMIIDAGANIGLTSVYFSAQCPDALIVAIEPEPSNFALLQHNVAGLPVIPVPCALAAQPQKMMVVDPGEREWGFQAKPVDAGHPDAIEVDCVTIDEIYHRHGSISFPFIVKIDIEGGEEEVFSDNIEWIDRTPLIIVELHDWMMPKKRTSQSFLRAIVGRDRDFIHIGENIFSIANNLDLMKTRIQES
jgi:FkbM family methyltransferase